MASIIIIWAAAGLPGLLLLLRFDRRRLVSSTYGFGNLMAMWSRCWKSPKSKEKQRQNFLLATVVVGNYLQ